MAARLDRFEASSVWYRSADGRMTVLAISSVMRASTPMLRAYCSRAMS